VISTTENSPQGFQASPTGGESAPICCPTLKRRAVKPNLTIHYSGKRLHAPSESKPSFNLPISNPQGGCSRMKAAMLALLVAAFFLVGCNSTSKLSRYYAERSPRL
jgi:hypothetical protein